MTKPPSYPHINCCVPGCRRGTTRFPPGDSIVCGKCWRQAPKALRDQYSRWRRKARALERANNPRSDIAWDRCSRTYWRIVRLLSRNDDQDGELPPLMGEELRKLGL